MDRSFQRQNDASRERLAALVATLTPTQLSIDLGEGWTVASALAHAGFWDRWQAERWERMLAGTWTFGDASLDEIEHLANEALHQYWAGVDAADIPQLALDAAEQLDALIASAPDDLVERVLASSSAYLVRRFNHRNDHLDHIERTIAAAAAKGNSAAGDFPVDNAASRRRLAELVARLRPEDLALPTEPTSEGSWTVAQQLVHLAFWDRALEARWNIAVDAAGADGPLDLISFGMGAADVINWSLAKLIDAWASALGPAVGTEALAAAESVDATIERLAARLPAGFAELKPRVLERSAHRLEHIAQIEKAFAAAGR